jgi:hypothetical protein
MILEHIASGMYGAVVVEPRNGYPTKADREYVVIQSEVSRALEAKSTVVFFAIDGAIPPGAAASRKITALAASAPGVDKDSVRISREMASLAVSFDPRRGNLANVQESLDRRLAAMGLSLLAMRVMDSPGDLAAVRRR